MITLHADKTIQMVALPPEEYERLTSANVLLDMIYRAHLAGDSERVMLYLQYNEQKYHKHFKL